MVTVPVEGEHGIDEVFDGPRPGQVTVLGHVPDQQNRDTARLGQAHEPLYTGPRPAPSCLPVGPVRGRPPTARSPPRRGRDGGGRRPPRSRRCRGPPTPEMPRQRAQSDGPATHLGQRLLGGRQHHVEAARRHRAEHLEQQRRLPDAGRPEEEGDRAADHAAAKDAVEFVDPGRQRTCGVGRHVGERDRVRRVERRGRSGDAQPAALVHRWASGANVFHAPQLGQRPTHRSEVVPHAPHA